MERLFRIVTACFALSLSFLFFVPSYIYVSRTPQIGEVLDTISHTVQSFAVGTMWKGGDLLASVSTSIEQGLSTEVRLGWPFAGSTPTKRPLEELTVPSPETESIPTTIPTIRGLTANAYLVADVESGEILAAHDQDIVVPIASVSKLLTALTVVDQFDLSKKTRVSARAVATQGDYGELSAGETISVQGLLYALLMESSNDAAEVLAETVGRARMLEKINDEAQRLGLTHTLFEDPSGLDGYNSSTASDLFALLKHLSSDAPEIIETTRLRTKYWNGGSRVHQWTNTNPFVRHSYPGYMGGKHGYTWEADNTFAGLFKVNVGGTVRSVAIIVLGSSNLRGDVDRVLSVLHTHSSLVAQTAVSR